MSDPSHLPPVEGNGDPPAEPVLALPTWVPALLGLVLVAMGALAVYTGLTYRAKPIVRGLVRRAGDFTQGRRAPGEQQPGASRVAQGEMVEATPEPNPTVEGQSKVAIKGTGSDINPVIRLTARRGAVLKVVPDDAIFHVNNQLMGPVRQYSTAVEAYEFPAEGSFTIRISAEGHADALYEVTVVPGAKDEVATIQARLQKR